MSQSSWPQQPPAPPGPPPYPPTGYQPSAPAAQPPVAWYHQKWFVVLACLLCSPVGVALLWQSPVTKRQGRIVWTVITSLMFIALVRRTPATPPATKPIAPTTATAQQPAPASTPVSATANPAPVTAPPATPPAPPAPVKAAPSWQTVKSWKGRGIKETESFTTTNREWRITWKTSNEQIAGLLQIMVNDENGGMVSLAANAQGAGSDTSYVRTKPGRYYLQINSANIDWDITVEEQR